MYPAAYYKSSLNKHLKEVLRLRSIVIKEKFKFRYRPSINQLADVGLLLNAVNETKLSLADDSV